MSSDIVINAEKLGKSYQLNHKAGGGRQGYQRLSEKLMQMAAAPFRRLGGARVEEETREEFWALRDVSFQVRRGEVLGVIGRNGAGKSTLLKLLSRITEPTTGSIELDGRIASLLEVGTGFHPELTGRENVFLNGAILGMSRVEIRRKFDEIVAFAEVEKFLDTPVKRYSSGMYVRLAFAVAAHLEPEILIVDEVLAVGDAQFQRKCLGKMGQVAGAGRTVIFVSHNTNAVERLTTRCLYLGQGKVKAIGATAEVLEEYLKASVSNSESIAAYRVAGLPETASLVKIATSSKDGESTRTFRPGEAIRVCLEINVYSSRPLDVGVAIENHREQPLFSTHLTDMGGALEQGGVYQLEVDIPAPRLRHGQYAISVALFSPDMSVFFDVIHHYPLLEISGSASEPFPEDKRWGDLYYPLQWHVRKRSN